MTLTERELVRSARGAVPPWFSADSGLGISPSREIEHCLSCPYSAADCDRCDGRGTITARGRPSRAVDMGRLRDMMLRHCSNREMCAALGVSEPTLIKAKRKLLKGEHQ